MLHYAHRHLQQEISVMTPRECQDLGAQIEAEQDPAKKAQLQARYNEFCLTDGSGNHVPTPPPPPVN